VRRILFIAAVACALAAAAPAGAGAQLDALYDEYLNFGVIGGCAHTQDELETALKDIPADIRAYDPGFATALTNALEQRASGCEEAQQLAEDVLIPTLFGTSEAADGSPGPAAAAISVVPPPSPPAAPETESGTWIALLFGGLVALAAVLVFVLRPRGTWD
jgi:hypothetical protein